MRSKKRGWSFCTSRADDDEEIGAVTRFCQSRHDPAGGLQHAEVAILTFAQHMVDHAAGLVGQRHDGANSVHVRAEAARKAAGGRP